MQYEASFRKVEVSFQSPIYDVDDREKEFHYAEIHEVESLCLGEHEVVTCSVHHAECEHVHTHRQEEEYDFVENVILHDDASAVKLLVCWLVVWLVGL